jgi:hypothetical protein
MRGSLSKTVLCLAAMMTILSFGEGLRAEMTDKTILLPKTIGVWTKPAASRIIDSDNIFDYMNGAGELYLAYGFDHLEVYEYTADQQDSILVEVYFMKTSDDAFGLLSQDWGGEPVNISPAAPNQANLAVAPARALYGGGLMRIWADTVYARIMAYRETAASKEAILSLGRSIQEGRRMPAEPELLNSLPQKLGPDWQLRKDRIGYFRSHLVLNSLYYLSHQNILALDHSSEAVTAPYENLSEAKTAKRVQVLLVNYATSERARQGLDIFHAAYLQEYPRRFDPNHTHNPMNTFSIEDGWLGYALNEAFLTVVFECPSQKSAEMFIKHIPHNVSEKEVDHEN